MKSAEVTLSLVSYDHGLNIVLTPESAAKFRDFTQAILGRQTQMLINDKVVMEPPDEGADHGWSHRLGGNG